MKVNGTIRSTNHCSELNKATLSGSSTINQRVYVLSSGGLYAIIKPINRLPVQVLFLCNALPFSVSSGFQWLENGR